MELMRVARSVIIGLGILALPLSLALAQTSGEPIRIVGAAIDPNRGGAGHIQFDITRWSTNAETDRLLAVLEEQGQQALVTAFQKNLRVGSMRMAGQLAYDLRYASQSPIPDGGTAITLATDRPISFAEIRNQTRSVNYPFTWIQIKLNKDGEGEGTMSLVAKVISAGGRDIVLENYDLMQPIRLTQLKTEKLKR